MEELVGCAYSIQELIGYGSITRSDGQLCEFERLAAALDQQMLVLVLA